MKKLGCSLVALLIGCAGAESEDALPGGDASVDGVVVEDDGHFDAHDADTATDGAETLEVDSSSDAGADASADTTETVLDGGIDSGGIDSGGIDSGGIDSGALDSGGGDTGAMDATPVGPITGGPCASGAPGATAIRLRFYNGGGKPTLAYDVWGLPDKSRQKAGVYGYTIPYTVPAWADPFLGEGGLQLDSSNFVDIELSTIGLSSISSVTLSIYGRSYNTTASGSFNWQTFKGTGATPTNFVSNVAPYKWYGGNATAAFTSGDGGARLRIKAGPSSGSLVVNKIELCMEAN